MTPVLPIEVSIRVAPDGRWMVLLQPPDGWVLMTSRDARRVANMLMVAADELDEVDR